MSRHTVIALCFLVAIAAALGGCTSGVPLTTSDGQTYEVLSSVFANEYAGRVPSEGTEFLLVTIQGNESQLDDMEALFFGKNSKAQVTDGASTVECTLIVYAPRASQKLDVILLFQVPTSFSSDFSLFGDGFASTSLSVQKS